MSVRKKLARLKHLKSGDHTKSDHEYSKTLALSENDTLVIDAYNNDQIEIQIDGEIEGVNNHAILPISIRWLPKSYNIKVKKEETNTNDPENMKDL